MHYTLTTPVPSHALQQLRAGDTVALSGTIYTARDAAHQRMMELLQQGKPLPFPIQNGALYYVGPTPPPPGRVIGSAGPTTSGRMDAYTPALLDLGLKIMIGKGKRNQSVREALCRNGAVYLAALGGGGALMASHILSVQRIAWEDLGCEAMRKLTAEGLPLTVILDTLGNDLYELGPESYRTWASASDRSIL